MKSVEFRLLWPFYITTLISSSFSVAVPIWVIFFQSHFSFLQISIALSLQALAAILFEIPSGSLADVFGRKYSVVTGIVLQGILWLFLPFIRSALLLYTAFFMIGAARTLESGADKAWMVDWLKANRQGTLVREMFLKLHGLHSAGSVIGSLMASVMLFSFEAWFLFWVQGGGYILEGALLLLFAKESACRCRKKHRLAGLFTKSVQTSKTGVAFVWHNKPVLYLLLASTFAVCSKDFGCIAWQPLLVDLSLPAEHLGVVFSIAGALGIIAPLLAKGLLKALEKESNFLLFTNSVEFLLLLSLCFIDKPFVSAGVMVYLLVMLVSDLQLPILSSCFHSLIPNKIRATVASVQSVVFAVSSLAVTAVAGYLMDTKGPKYAMVMCSFLLVPAGILYAGMKSSRARFPRLEEQLDRLIGEPMQQLFPELTRFPMPPFRRFGYPFVHSCNRATFPRPAASACTPKLREVMFRSMNRYWFPRHS